MGYWADFKVYHTPECYREKSRFKKMHASTDTAWKIWEEKPFDQTTTSLKKHLFIQLTVNSPIGEP